MFFIRSQIENLNREEFIEELVKLSNIADQIKELTDKFDNFFKKVPRTQIRFSCY